MILTTLITLLSPFVSFIDLAQQPALALIENEPLPSNARVVYQGDGYLLAFLPLGQESSNAQILLMPTTPGDYYIMRPRSAVALRGISGQIPFVRIGRDAVFRANPQQAAELSRYGWGLTLLSDRAPAARIGSADFPPAIAAVDSNILEMISDITAESSRQLIVELSAIATRYSFQQGCRDAEQYVFDQLAQMGLNTSFHTFQYWGTTMRNVIGEKVGQAYPESIIIVCGHLDCTSETPNVLAPGAEDNGTGSAVVLEVARVLSAYPCDLTLRFVTFSGEEQGLIGSDRYAAYVQGLGENIAAVINADMVGYSGPYAQDMYIFSDPLSHGLGALASSVIAEYTPLDTVPVYGSSPEYGSDHYPFAQRGYRAIFFIDAWFDYDWYPYYHTVADTVGHLNMAQQASIGQATAAMAAILARPDFGPQYLAGDANGSGDVTGLDVVYMVNYLKGYGPAPRPLLSGDANGDCQANGIDVVYLVNYFKGGPLPFYGECR
jgi:hypothetical protein